MNQKESVFGRTIDCACGKTHHILPRDVIYGEDAALKIPEIAAGITAGRRVAVLFDARTRRAAGDEIVGHLSAAGWIVSDVLVPDPGQNASPVCDDVTKDRLNGEIPQQDLFLPVGSGVLSDLGKWLAFDRGLPFVTFATAASMNGYASANVAPTVGGVKTLVRARPPEAVFSAPSVLRDAPWELTAAGLGDIIAKSVSAADWYLNHYLFGDYYCERSVGLIADVEPLYLNHPRALRDGAPESLEALYRGLLLTGVSMTMAESSAPSSGGEHMVSHTLDMMSSVDNVPHDLHGRQVGVGTILASELYRRVLAVESPSFSVPRIHIDKAFWGRLTENVAHQYAQKVDRLQQATNVLSEGGVWDGLRAGIAHLLRSPDVIRNCLRAADAAYRAEDIGCSGERLITAFLHAHEIRSRFTILDLAYLCGILPDAAKEIVEETC